MKLWNRHCAACGVVGHPASRCPQVCVYCQSRHTRDGEVNANLLVNLDSDQMGCDQCEADLRTAASYPRYGASSLAQIRLDALRVVRCRRDMATFAFAAAFTGNLNEAMRRASLG